MALKVWSWSQLPRRMILACALFGSGYSCDASRDIAARSGQASDPHLGGQGGARLDPEPLGGQGGGILPITETLVLTGDLGTHDPGIVVAGDLFFVFSTGRLLPMRVSSDLHHWEAAGTAFSEQPAWISERLSGVTDLWAPEVTYFSGKYHLYYAASTFGSGRSCIGHATSPELTAHTEWQDEGYIICSDVDEEVDWDAIDPSAFADENQDYWLAFGSYGSGIKLIRLDAEGRRLGEEFHSLAERPVEVALQGPSALYREGYYYLFASYDFCCSGLNSTSNIRVGRASQVTGPYVDRDGVALLEGGGLCFFQGTNIFREQERLLFFT